MREQSGREQSGREVEVDERVGKGLEDFCAEMEWTFSGMGVDVDAVDGLEWI